MDLSFILPTDRPHKYAAAVIKSIRDADHFGMDHEIVVVSPDKMEGENIRWIRDPAPGTGGCHAYNLACQQSTGDFIIGCVDTLILHPQVLRLVETLKTCNWRFKVITMMPPGVGNMDTVNIPPVPFVPRVGHIIIARETIEKELNGWLFNPSFKHGAVDQWMGYWMHLHGETPVWDNQYQNRFVDDLTPHSADVPHFSRHDDHDRATMRRLYFEVKAGLRKVYAP